MYIKWLKEEAYQQRGNNINLKISQQDYQRYGHFLLLTPQPQTYDATDHSNYTRVNDVLLIYSNSVLKMVSKLD